MRHIVRSLSLAVTAIAATAGMAVAADLPVKARPPSLYTPTPWVNVFTGFSVSPDSYFGDVGAVFAFNHNLYADGWLFRIRGGAGHYDYDRAPGFEQSASYQVGEFMIGYQTFWGATRLSGYIGPNFHHTSNSDPFANVHGDKWGVKVQGEIFTPLGDTAYLLLLANASSVWSSYYILGKLGYNLSPGIAVGPELAFLGNDRFDAVRFGPVRRF